MEDQQILTFFSAIEGHRFQYLYLVDLFTGMRQSELLGLQWADVDLEGKTVTVKRQLQYLGGTHGGYQYATPKSNKARLIVLPDKAVEAFEHQKDLQDAMKKAAGEAWSNPDNLVFTNELGEHLKHDVVYRNLKRIFVSMGLPNLCFHDLRHPNVKPATKDFYPHYTGNIQLVRTNNTFLSAGRLYRQELLHLSCISILCIVLKVLRCKPLLFCLRFRNIYSLNFENNGPCAIVTASYHHPFIVRPSVHNGTALESCIHISTDCVPGFTAEFSIHQMIKVVLLTCSF